MDFTVLPVSVSLSTQRPPSVAEPMSAELLQYHLSRTPTPRRFHRSRLANPPEVQDIGITSGPDNRRHSGTDFRLAPEVISNDATVCNGDQSHRATKQTPRHNASTVPPDVRAALSPLRQPATHVPCIHPAAGSSYMIAVPEVSETPRRALLSGQEADDMTLNDAIREAARIKLELTQRSLQRDIKSPTGGEDPPSVPQGHVVKIQPSSSSSQKKKKLIRPTKRTPLPSGPPAERARVSKQTADGRQFSLPDEEILPKPTRRSRARRLPVDELELAEERVASYDAPPISDSEDADSDPVEEQADNAARPQSQDRGGQTINRSTVATKNKPLPVKTSLPSKRPQLLAGFKVIKRAVALSTIGQKPIVGDGFEGPERLTTGRAMRFANKKTHARPQVARPKTYFRALDIVESKPCDVPPQQGPTLSGVEVEDTIFASAEDHGNEPVMGFDSVFYEHNIDEELDKLVLADHQDVAEMVEVSPAQGREEDENGPHEARFLEASVLQTAQPRDLAPADILGRGKPEKMQPIVLPGAVMPDECIEEDTVSFVDPQDKSVARGGHSVSQSQEPKGFSSGPPRNLHGVADTELNGENTTGILPVTRLKRTVTFSDEVKVDTVVELEFDNEEDEDEDEDTSSMSQSLAESGSESEQQSEKSQDSDAEESSEEGNDTAGSEGDDEDEDEEGNYPTDNISTKFGSPELVSSGYCAVPAIKTQPYFSFHEDDFASRDSAEIDGYEQGEDDMILDADDSVEQRPQLDSPEARGLENFIDSEDELLIAISRASYPFEELLPEGDVIDLNEVSAVSERRRRTMRGDYETQFYDVPDPPAQLVTSSSNWSRYAAGTNVAGDDELPSTRDENYEETYQSDEGERNCHHQSMLTPERAKSLQDSTAAVFTPHSRSNKAIQVQQPDYYDRLSTKHYSNKPGTSTPMTPEVSEDSMAFQVSHYGITRSCGALSGSRKVKRAKTGLAPLEGRQASSPIKRTVVADVPSYFARASQALSSPSNDLSAMMRRARTLPSTQYISKSGDEDGFRLMSDESFRDRLSGKKRHLSLSDRVEAEENMDLRAVVNRSNLEMGRSFEVKRKRSLPFKSPFGECATGI